MITYANFFCFCMGIAIVVYRPNLVFIFPVVVLALIVYFNHAMTSEAARLEPEQLMKNPARSRCFAPEWDGQPESSHKACQRRLRALAFVSGQG
jgi:hypothetical protein